MGRRFRSTFWTQLARRIMLLSVTTTSAQGRDSYVFSPSRSRSLFKLHKNSGESYMVKVLWNDDAHKRIKTLNFEYVMMSIKLKLSCHLNGLLGLAEIGNLQVNVSNILLIRAIPFGGGGWLSWIIYSHGLKIGTFYCKLAIMAECSIQSFFLICQQVCHRKVTIVTKNSSKYPTATLHDFGNDALKVVTDHFGMQCTSDGSHL